MSKNVLSRDGVIKIFDSQDYEAIAKELIGIAFYEEEFDFAFNTILKFTNHLNEQVRGNAILCLGHLARIHKNIPEHPTVQLLKNALNDQSEYVRGQAESAVDDIRIYMPEIGKLFSI